MSETETIDDNKVVETETETEAAEAGTSDRIPDDHPLVKALAAQKAKNKELASKASKLDELENAQKSELQKALERAEAAEKRAAEAEFESTRSKVAATKGVPAAALFGSTEDELNAAADGLLEWRGKAESKPEHPAPKRTSPERLRSGASGSAVTESDPKAAAAEALRRFRNDR